LPAFVKHSIRNRSTFARADEPLTARSASLGIALALMLPCPLAVARQDAATDDSVAQEMQRHQADLSRIEARMQALEQQIAERQQRRDALFAELERNERDIAALALAGRQFAAMTAAQEAVVAGVQVKLDQAREDLDVARLALAQLLRSAYAMGRGDRLRMLLNQEDMTRSGRVFGYYRCIGRERGKRIEAVEALAEELTRLRQQEDVEAQRLRQLATHQEETRIRLLAAQRAREAIVASLDRNIAEGRGKVTALGENAQGLRDLITDLRLKAQIAAEIDLTREEFSVRRGRLAWPVPGARLISGFRSSDNPQDLHADGVLIAADEGTEVTAVHHGRVIYADWLRGFGLLLVLDHGDGYMTLYGHNQTLLKEVGEWVDTGEVVALTGRSGGSGDRGLYFALRKDGAPLDPAHWCGQG
jgi:septal ring factor EnvC (AmiA/AmiB activator)